MSPTGSSARRRVARLVVAALVASTLTALSTALTTTSASAATPVPPRPAGLPSAVEAYQPFVGQKVCDPVAKPGVRAFATLVLDTYPTTSSLGIVRDCGIGGTSEHKEGRAWDWGVSAFDAADKARADTLVAWLLKTGPNGQLHEMARRTGLMYMIWNKRIWKSYASGSGWQTYTGPNPHTDHVHFSFGWNGAKKVTSYWDGTVAPVDYGPSGTTTTTTASVTPVASPNNLKIVHDHGALTLSKGSTGTPVKVMQAALKIEADGFFGSDTDAAVRSFQSSQGLAVTGSFGPAEWKRLFPFPVTPFGALESVTTSGTTTTVKGWAMDADTSSSIKAALYVDGVYNRAPLASVLRTDVATRYPGRGDMHGYSMALTLPDGPHNVCTYGLNVAGTPGVNAKLGCRSIVVSRRPFGASEGIRHTPGAVTLRGWTADPDAPTTPLKLAVTAGGTVLQTVAADDARSDIGSRYPAYGPNHGYLVRQSTAAVPAGARAFCAVARNVGTGTDKTLGCTTVQVVHAPFGKLELVRRGPSGLAVRGWAIEPDAAVAANVRLLLDGRAVLTKAANATRSDVGAAHPVYGSAHGFTATLPTPAAGSHTVCADALNTGPGANTRLGCVTLTVSNKPFGVLDPPTVSADRRITARGWAVDPDTAAGISANVYVNGVYAAGAKATRYDRRLAAGAPGYGFYHGYAITLPKTYARGDYRVCAYGINAGAGSLNGALGGCRTVAVR